MLTYYSTKIIVVARAVLHFCSYQVESDFFTKAGYNGVIAAGSVADKAAVVSETNGRVAKDTFLVSRP